MACQVLIVEDDDAFADLLRVVIERDERLAVVSRVRNGEDAIAAARELAPDAITMDIDMPVLGGVEATRAIVAEMPDAQVVVVSGSIYEAEIDRARRAGAAAYVHKPEAIEHLPEVLLAVCRGERFLHVA